MSWRYPVTVGDDESHGFSRRPLRPEGEAVPVDEVVERMTVPKPIKRFPHLFFKKPRDRDCPSFKNKTPLCPGGSMQREGERRETAKAIY